MIRWVFQGVTAIAVALIAYWGTTLADTVKDISNQATANSTRLTAIEANRYTAAEAKTDNEKHATRLTAIEVRAAADTAKLDAIQRELNSVSQNLAKLVDRDRRSP